MVPQLMRLVRRSCPHGDGRAGWGGRLLALTLGRQPIRQLKAILSRFADEIELDQVDWDDFASVNQTWKHFLQNLERRA